MKKPVIASVVGSVVVVFVLSLGGLLAQPSGFSFGLPHGYFRSIGDNETSLVSTKDDPPKHRQGLKWQEGWGRSLGAQSFNHVRPNGTEDEIVLIQGKMDDRFAFGPEAAGEWRLDIKAPGPNVDANMRGVMNAFHDKIQFNVPISAPNLQGGGTVPNFMDSPNGCFRTQQQDDGNFVTYDKCRGPQWIAVWSAWTGRIQ